MPQSDSLIGIQPNSIANAIISPSLPQHAAEDTSAVGVLHLINGEHFSGAERVQQNLGLHLGQFGFDAHFACLKPGKFPHCSGLPAKQVHATPMRGRFDWRVIDRIQSVVAKTQCRILHAHTPRTALAAAFVANRMKLPWVYHIHSPAARDSTRGMINRINHWIERFSIASCSQLITVSRSLRREMLSRGVKRKRLVAIPNGVAAIVPIDPESRLQQNAWNLGLIALMRPRKGVEVALEAMAQLKQLPITMELIGSFETPEYQRQVVNMIRKLGLDKVVKCTGFTRDIPSAIRRLDALVLPSLFGEGMPMVVLEALSAGVPVIATRVEGTPEVIRHGVEGVLANPRDANDLAEKISEMTSNRQCWMAMSFSALRRHRSRYSDMEMARRVARVYDRLLTL